MSGPTAAEARRAVLVFARAPRLGQVKTRLAASLGDEAALALHQAFVGDALAVCLASGLSTILCHTGNEAEVRGWLEKGVAGLAQRGRDLGERLKHGFEDALAMGCSGVLAVGGDVPRLTPALLREAADRLDASQAVLGPALDGGYYLLGLTLQAYSPILFEGIDWGTDRVLAQTSARLDQAGLTASLMPRLGDVDTLEDLMALARDHAPGVLGPRTARLLASLGLTPIRRPGP